MSDCFIGLNPLFPRVKGWGIVLSAKGKTAFDSLYHKNFHSAKKHSVYLEVSIPTGTIEPKRHRYKLVQKKFPNFFSSFLFKELNKL
jgi:hypothetical protein